MNLSRRLLWFFALSLAPLSGFAQSPPPPNPPAAAPADGSVIRLDPFRTNAKVDSGYTAEESVAATRMAVPLKDLPINVQVISGEFLADAEVLDMVDALRYKGVNANRDIRFNSTFIRGFNNRILKRNGVRRDLNWGTANVDSMEIVKGPASILYGEANPGGTILYTTKKPVARDFATLDNQFGTDGFYRSVLDAGGRVTRDDRVLVRVVAERQDSKNFYDGSYVDRWFANPTLTWRINPKLTLELDYENTYHKEDQTMYFFRTTQAVMNAAPVTMDNLPTPVPFAHAEIKGLSGQVALTEFFTRAGHAPVSDHYQAQSPDSHVTLTTNWYEATTSYRLDSNWVVRWKVAYEDTHDDELQFGAEGNSAVLNGGILGVADWDGRQVVNRRLTSFAEATGVYHLGKFPNTVLLGTEYRHDNLNAPVLVPPTQTLSPVTGKPLPVRGNLVVLPLVEFPLVRFANVPGAGVFAPKPSTILERDTGYGFDQIETPDHRWLALFGLRYEQAKDNPLSVGVKPNTTFNTWTHQVGLAFQPATTQTIFFNYSESYLPNETVNPDGTSFKPESGTGYELGLRSNWLANRLGTTLTVWQNTRENILEVDQQRTYNDPTHNPNNLVYNDQGGRQRAHGADAEASFAVSRTWQVIGSFSWIPFAKTLENTSNPLMVGNRMRYVPRAAGSLWVKFEPTPAWRIYGGNSFQSATQWDDTGLLGTYHFKPWMNWDMGAGYTFRFKRYSFSIDLFGQNLTDNELTTVIHPQDRRRLFLKTSIIF